MNSTINCVSNNVKGLHDKSKRIKMFLYLKDLISNNGFIFLQETHSSAQETTQWCNDFGSKNIFFSHGTTGACGVAIGICLNEKFEIKKNISDLNGRFLILELVIGNNAFILINLYNANTQADQVKTLNELDAALKDLDLCPSKKIIFGGDFNVFFDKSLEAKGGNPALKLNSIATFLKFKESMELIDIWRIRNPPKKRYTFRQRHFSGFLQRRLDYFFVSSNLQQNIDKAEIANALYTDHSPIIIKISPDKKANPGPGSWKFNNSLLIDDVFVQKMDETIRNLLIGSDFNPHLKWEYLSII